MFTIARKAKVAEATDNFDDSHSYKCLRCGAEHDNPIGKYYKIQWSDLWLKNDRYAPYCKTCINEIFTAYEKKYDTETACKLLCYKLDIPYYYTLFSSIVKNNNSFSIGLMLRQMNNRQYQYQDFSQTILNGELGKTVTDHELDKEVKWSKTDTQNRDYSIEVIGYDPFEGYPEEDRRFLFNQLFPYLEDDDIADDTFKLSQILQVVDNNKQIRQCDLKIANIDPIKDANDIKTLNSIKTSLVASNDKIAKENEISVKNRSNKDVGKSTLTYLMRDLREKHFDKAETDYYDQLKSAGTLWAMEMSNKAILQNGMFDENDKKEVYEIQLNLINKLTSELDDYKEQIRLLTREIDELKVGVNDGEA